MYGAQWRGKSSTQPVDQLVALETALSKRAYNRRLIVNAWNPQDMPLMALPLSLCLASKYLPRVRKINTWVESAFCDTVLGSHSI